MTKKLKLSPVAPSEPVLLSKLEASVLLVGSSLHPVVDNTSEPTKMLSRILALVPEISVAVALAEVSGGGCAAARSSVCCRNVIRCKQLCHADVHCA
ncbi:MAG: hypothetical protein SFX73_38765 [Kofleriaceae bacterium]|nr:hypothetical protein [Kofleriaceae bacterium]